MSDPYIGEIRMAAFGFTPRGWAQCNGQLLPISQNQALFALLGTYYGGDGVTIFALPDFRGRIPLYFGSIAGAKMSTHTIGEKGGSEKVALTVKSAASTVGSTTTYIDGAAPPPDNMMPYLALNFIIATSGIFPSRD